VHAPASLLEIVWYIIWGACLYILCFQDRQAEICTIIFWKPQNRLCNNAKSSWSDWLCTPKRRTLHRQPMQELTLNPRWT